MPSGSSLDSTGAPGAATGSVAADEDLSDVASGADAAATALLSSSSLGAVAESAIDVALDTAFGVDAVSVATRS
jgi:hypothetical protein